ncbi:CoA-binding protein [Oscillatoria sp. FACHB-1406]|uniref:succinate--CoA ligase subunit alpha n=1 Tax=Oscillatoria sp. FACHB-1406 TaxID=2692846 RepID=UPI001687F016|nr:CoA-binding protein [Oscillatoria sp. FACHB-1406]MBD2579745.1 CoA-binding protein [Oscillatoria sp. FACHB-1406]
MIFTPHQTVLVQGILTPLGRDCAERMKAYGTNVIAGTSAGWGGETFQEIPIYHLVEDAIAASSEIATSVICVPPYEVLDAVLEAIAAGVRQLIICTCSVPPVDMLRAIERARCVDALILGPGSAGVILPGEVLIGTLSSSCYHPGNVGIIARTDNLMDAIAWELAQAKLGQSLAINLGTAAIVGSGFQEWLPILERDKRTEAIVVLDLDASGNSADLLEALGAELQKPVVAFIAGTHLPYPESHSDGAFILADYLARSALSSNRAEAKVTALKKGKVTVANRPSQVVSCIKKILRKKGDLS